MSDDERDRLEAEYIKARTECLTNQPNDFAAPEFREIIQAMKSATKEEIATLFAADTALRRMGFPKEAQNLRGIAAIAIVMKGRK